MEKKKKGWQVFSLEGLLAILNISFLLAYFLLEHNYRGLSPAFELVLAYTSLVMMLPLGILLSIGGPSQSDAFVVFALIFLGLNSICWGYCVAWIVRKTNFQFSIRTLLILTTLIAILVALLIAATNT